MTRPIPFAFQVRGSSVFGIQSKSRTLLLRLHHLVHCFQQYTLPGFLKCFGYITGYGFAVLLFLLSSCSVHTLNSYDSSIYDKVPQIKLGKIEGKNLYIIRQDFIAEFYPMGCDIEKEKHYVLHIKLNDSVAPWIIQSNSEILKNVLTLVATFELDDIRTGKRIKMGTVRTLRTFLESPSAWSSYTSEIKAYERAVADVMKSVRMMIFTYFSADENKFKRP